MSSSSKKHMRQEASGDEQQITEIQANFEGCNPQDPDYHGIKTLLLQLFLKAHIDIGGLTDLIISQNYVGSVIKQCDDDDDDDDSDMDDDNLAQQVCGITTVVNISNRQNVQCIQQLRDSLRQHAKEYATDAVNTLVNSVLEDDAAPLGLLINERIINIPAQISVPLLENLVCEVKRAVNKKMPFNFAYYIMICKIFKSIDKKKGKDKKESDPEEPSILWSNPEEELFAEEATCHFEFPVEVELANGPAGTWAKYDSKLVPYRRVLLFEDIKLPEIINKIKSELA